MQHQGREDLRRHEELLGRKSRQTGAERKQWNIGVRFFSLAEGGEKGQWGKSAYFPDEKELLVVCVSFLFVGGQDFMQVIRVVQETL